jgi:hypothetical protein
MLESATSLAHFGPEAVIRSARVGRKRSVFGSYAAKTASPAERPVT